MCYWHEGMPMKKYPLMFKRAQEYCGECCFTCIKHIEMCGQSSLTSNKWVLCSSRLFKDVGLNLNQRHFLGICFVCVSLSQLQLELLRRKNRNRQHTSKMERERISDNASTHTKKKSGSDIETRQFETNLQSHLNFNNNKQTILMRLHFQSEQWLWRRSCTCYIHSDWCHKDTLQDLHAILCTLFPQCTNTWK